MIIASYFQAIEKVKFSNTVTLCRGLIFIMAGLFILPEILNVNGIWLTAPAAEMLTVFVCWFLLEIYKREVRNLIPIEEY